MSQTFAQLINGKSATVEFSTGSASTPSVAFSGDTNTGIFSPGADQVAISTGGSGRLFINSAGNVGIGAANTGAAFLEVGGSLRWQTQGIFRNSTNTSTLLRFAEIGSRDVRLDTWDGTDFNGTIRHGAQTYLVETGTGASLTERLRITSAGLVGIGNTPEHPLDVSGTIRVKGTTDATLFIDSASGSKGFVYWRERTVADRGILGFANGSGDLVYRSNAYDFSSGTERLRITSGGNVGIGTTSPSTTLHVRGGNGNQLYVDNDGSQYSGIEIRNNNTDKAFIQYNNSTPVFNVGTRTGVPLAFLIAESEKARIDTSGRLLVGTSTAVDTSSGCLIQVAQNDNPGAICLARNDGIITSGDALGVINFRGTETGVAPYFLSAQIECAADADWSASGDYPSRLVFSVTRDGASSPTEAARINNAGFFKATGTGSYQSATDTYHEFVSASNGREILTIIHNGTTGNQYGLSILTANNQDDATRWFLYCQGGGVQKAVIRSNGGLANFSANDVNLSDRNVKKDISPATGTWDCIKEWEIVNYRYKDQPDDADLNLGVIAQQVAESCPEVVTVFQEAQDAKPAVLDDDGNEVEAAQEAQPEKLGVKEQQMYWMAIKALQEAQIRIEALEAEVAALKAQ